MEEDEQRTVVKALHSMVQERHLALEMSSSERLTSERREKTHVKQQGGKASVTKAQEDISINIFINSRLLICKA
jgi:hypothetical protein